MTALDLLAHHEADQLVAFGGAGHKTAAHLLEDAGRISASLPEAQSGSHVLLVLENDRYAMAAALLGVLSRGHAVALPPNARRDSILAVHDRPETIATIHDSESGIQFRYSDLLETGESAAPLRAPFRPVEGPMATVFTSGTTGESKAWMKGPAELLGEAHMLGRTFEIGPGDRILGTVAPGHIYGLLFTVLLPLARGAAFCRETPHHAAAVAHCALEHEATVLVTVPVGLRAFAALAPRAFPSVQRVFSSTGPLSADVAADFRERHGHPVTEILGSTETGGIASRERRGGAPDQDERWAPLAGVELSTIGTTDEDRRLLVDSPFIHRNLSRPFETQDLVRMNDDGTFTHLGRADGIVKIGGRRVSVQDVEECIRQHPDVEDAAVAAIPAEGGRGHQLVAAVAPAHCSTSEIKAALRKRFEPTCLPRRILRVDALPKEANGKVPRARLMRMFGLRADGRAINWSLDWDEPRRTTDAQTETFEVGVALPEDYAWFDGHFESYPVLAGAAQLKDLLLPTVKRAFPNLGPLQTMNRIKFLKPIQPGDQLSIRLERAATERRVQFEIRKASGAICSAGHLAFASSDKAE